MIIKKSKNQISKSKENQLYHFLCRGQSMFEVVFALAIAAMIVTGVASLATVSVRNSTFSRNNAQAGRYAQEASEWLREERDKDWDSFRGQAETTTWCLRASPLSWNSPTTTSACGDSDFIASTIFRREVVFSCFESGVGVDCSDTGVDEVLVAISVFWNDSQGDHEVRNTTDLTNWNK